MVKQALDSLCEQVKGCETLAYVDLSTSMVLLTNSSSPESQDTLNTLCLEASLILQSGNSALTGSSDRMRLFLRAMNEPSDVLCCVCELNTDIEQLLPAARECLNQISDGGATNG